MKKILTLVLCFVFVFSLTACKKDKENEIQTDIVNYAAKGQISGIEYKLGDSIAETKTALSETVDDHGDSSYFDYEAKDYTVMTDGMICCCYKTSEESAGVSHIVKYGDAYGFDAGAVSTQVRDTMTQIGYSATERDAKQGELFFMPSSANMTVLEYEIEGTTVLFAFQEHALSATMIYK